MRVFGFRVQGRSLRGSRRDAIGAVLSNLVSKLHKANIQGPQHIWINTDLRAKKFTARRGAIEFSDLVCLSRKLKRNQTSPSIDDGQ